MDAFREHFLRKYFGYRRRYVDYVAGEAPARAALAVLSEIARLAFAAFGAALCAIILGTLTTDALRREGVRAWPVVFALLTLSAAVLFAFALGGMLEAFGDRRRVEEKIGRRE